jgi:hypothetical protein
MMAPMKRIMKKIVLITSGTVAGLIVLTAVLLMTMPYVVSSKAVKDRLEILLTDTLDHAVTIKKIEWSWRQGIAISEVRLQDHPDFSHENLAVVGDISLKIDWPQLLKRRLIFDARIAAPRIHLIRLPDGRINMVDGFAKADPTAEHAEKKDPDVKDAPPAADAPADKPAPDEKAKPEKKAGADGKPFVLPLDIIGVFELTDLFLVLDDQEAKRHIAVTNAGLRLDLPSLKNKPLRLALHVDLSVDHKPAPRSTVSVMVSGLFDEDGILVVQNTAVEADIDLPGFTAVLAGDMREAGIRGDINVNLDAMADLAYLFAPGLSERMRPTGRIHLAANSSGMPDAPISFDIRLTGEDLGFSGSVIKNRSLSSGNIKIQTAGTYDVQEGTLAIDTGRIRLLENTDLELSGKIDELTSGEPSADMTMASLDVHINEIVAFLADFMPDILALPDTGTPSVLSIQQLAFAGGLKSGSAKISCKTIGLDLPHIIITPAPADKTSRINLTGARLSITDAQSELISFFPVSAGLTAAIRADAFDMKSKDQDVSVKNLNLDALRVLGENIKKVPDSPFAVAGNFTLTESLHVGAVSILPLLNIKGLHQAIKLMVSLDENGILKAAMDSAGINIENAAATLAGEKQIILSGRFNAAFSEFMLSEIKPLTIDMSGFTAELAIDDALSLEIRADVSDTGRSMARGRAGMKADLALLTERFTDFIKPEMAAAGVLNLDLNMDGRLPDEKAMAGLKAMQWEGNLDFLTTLSFTALLPEGRLELGTDEKNRLTVAAISGDPLLSYSLNGRTGDGKLSCRWQIGDIEGLPGLKPENPVSADLIVDAGHRFLSAVDLDQRLNIDPIGIRQAITLSLDGLDRLLASGNMAAPYAALSRVGATLSAGVDMADLSRIKSMGVTGMPAMDLSGSVAARTDLHLIPGNHITGDIRLDMDRVNIDIKDVITVSDADAGITWSKTYKMVVLDPEHPDRITGGPLLSKQVLQPETLGTMRSRKSGNDIYRHLKQLKERTSPSSEISVNAVSMVKGPLPLNVGPSRIVMDVVNGIFGVNYFEFNLLGGTINGTLNLLNNQKDLRVRSTLNFSGVNTAAFFPELYSGRDDPRAEIRGMVYADIPVTHEIPVLLENMAISIEFTKIGSRAIERLLYALDPHESNEAVMAQRRILRNGSPRWIRIDIRDGFLSIRGEVTVRNINISLPAIQRLNIARLPGIEKYESAAAPLEAIALLLGRLSAETLTVNPDGRTILFK